MKLQVFIAVLALFVFGFTKSGSQFLTSVQPGAISTKTGLHFNTEQGFQVFPYQGFSEGKLIKGRFRKPAPTQSLKAHKKSLDYIKQLHFFDSLSVLRSKSKGSEFPFPGAISITEKISIDETEVTNLDWLEFLFYIRKDSSDEYYHNQLPDIEIIKLQEKDYFAAPAALGLNDPVITNYLRHPAYRFYPVVGITYEQALEYCKWRSDKVEEVYRSDNSSNKNNKSPVPVKVRFRLPTEQEWELAASCGLDKRKYPHGVFSPGTYEVKYQINPKAADFLAAKIATTKSKTQIMQDIAQSGYITDIFFHSKRPLPYFLQFQTPFHVYTFYPNDFGVYNMIGNVAEMTAEKGVAKGGSWKDDLSASEITDQINYKGASDKVGFRCVSEVVSF